MQLVGLRSFITLNDVKGHSVNPFRRLVTVGLDPLCTKTSVCHCFLLLSFASEVGFRRRSAEELRLSSLNRGRLVAPDSPRFRFGLQGSLRKRGDPLSSCCVRFFPMVAFHHHQVFNVNDIDVRDSSEAERRSQVRVQVIARCVRARRTESRLLH